MNLTNRSNLPDAILKAIRNDSYSKGESDYSVTELLQPPRVSALKRKHKHEIEEDAEDLIYRLYGQIAHGILERANENDLVEKRFFGKFQGKIISAQIDTLSLKNKILTDYKFSTVWKFKLNMPPDPAWEAQLNVQLELLRQNGYDAEKLQIVGLIRDYRIREARDFVATYPKSPIVIVPIEIWPREKTVSFINMRVQAHIDAEIMLPQCTHDERWAKPDIWAVVKGGRAVPGGLQFSREAAVEMSSHIPGTKVELRPSESIRCMNYCSVNKFCDQYLSTIKRGEA